MRYFFFCLSFLFLLPSLARANEEIEFVVEATCEGTGRCVVGTEGARLRIRLINMNPVPMKLPLAFLQKSGPIMRLVAHQSGREVYASRPLADPALRDVLTSLAPGESAYIDWLILPSDLDQLSPEGEATVLVTIETEAIIGKDVFPVFGSDLVRATRQ